MYPLTQWEDWPTIRPIDIIQVRLPGLGLAPSWLQSVVISCVGWEAILSADLCIAHVICCLLQQEDCFAASRIDMIQANCLHVHELLVVSLVLKLYRNQSQKLACACLLVSTAGAWVHNSDKGRLVQAVVVMCVLVGLW